MYCKTCGKKIPDDSRYCPNCGTNVSDLPFSDTDKRDDTELHVEYLRMSPSGEESLKQHSRSYDAPKWIKTFAQAISIYCALNIFLLIVTLILYHVLKNSGDTLKFKEIWCIVIGVVTVIGAAMNFAFHFIDKDYSLKNSRIQNRVKKSLLWRTIQFVFSFVAAGSLIAFSVLAMKNPSIISNYEVIFRIVPTISVFAYICFACVGFNYLNAYATKKPATPGSQNVVGI